MTAPRFGIWKPLPEYASQGRIRPTQMIAHSIVGSARGAYNYFRDSTSIESHWITTKAGEVWQLMDADRQADANYLANRRPDGTGALSNETEDNGNPDRDPWTHAQLQALIDWFRWGHDTFGIPLEVCRTHDAPGIGYHTLHPRHWTTVPSKTCPGVVRKQQFHDLIVPALRHAPPVKPEETTDMIGTEIIAAYGEAGYLLATLHPDQLAQHWRDIRAWTHAIYAKPEPERAGGVAYVRALLGL